MGGAASTSWEELKGPGYVAKHELPELLKHPHWSLRGPYAPIGAEIFEQDLAVEGQLPAELSGEYVRNGPNRLWNLPSAEAQWHWFLGEGMLHAVRLSEGKATYSSHFLRTSKFMLEQARGKPLTEVLQARSIKEFLLKLFGVKLGILAGWPENQGYNNTSVAYHSGRAMALCEADLPLEFRILQDGRLESEAKYLYCKERVLPNAHPKVDPVTGEMFWLNYNPTGLSATFSYGVVGPDGQERSQSSGALSGGKAVMIHDLGLTETHAVVLECPVLINVAHLQAEGTLWRYDASHGTRVGIFPRYASGAEVNASIKWFTVDTCMIFHVANCWQLDEKRTVMIAVRWDKVDMGGFKSPSLLESSTRLWRYEFNLETGAVQECCLFPDACDNVEFPVIHPSHVGRPTRYIFAVGRISKDEPDMHRLFKFDLSTNTVQSHALARGGRPLCGGEGCFVPRAGEGLAEDAGYLLSFAVDPAGEANSHFFVLDAQNMEASVAVVQLPGRVPHGFHGLWLTEEQLQRQLDEQTPSTV